MLYFNLYPVKNKFLRNYGGKGGWVLRDTVVEVACPSQPRARSCVVEHETNYELDLSR